MRYVVFEIRNLDTMLACDFVFGNKRFPFPYTIESIKDCLHLNLRQSVGGNKFDNN